MNAETVNVKNDLTRYRLGLPSDHPFIFATWLRGLYHGNESFKLMHPATFFKKYHILIEAILMRPNLKIGVVCLREDPDVILGYSVTEEREDSHLLHWVFVKFAWRNIGIAKDLIPTGINAVTHMTKIATVIKPHEWEYDPFLI